MARTTRPAPDPEPFVVDVPRRTLDTILDKVRSYPWDALPRIAGEDGWRYGTEPGYLRRLCEYWVDGYDWRAAERELNRFPQFVADVSGLSVHFLHVTGPGDVRPTVVLTHGWPGSVYEFHDVVDRLVHPELHGGRAHDGVDVVVPSLPGYGFSGRPARPIGPRRTAELWDSLLRETLGLETYVAQGGDWGAWVSAWLALDHPADRGGGCAALHLNFCGLHPAAGPRTEEERAWAERIARIRASESAYSAIQSTRPTTLSYAMTESPVGVAAWILEKFAAWSDTSAPGGGDDVENAFTKDELLTNIMIYLVTGSFATSTWMYRGRDDEGRRQMRDGVRVAVPTGVANFPAEFLPWPPRSFVERGYDVVRWTDMPRGGHFAALEEPAAFSREVLAFVRQVRP